MTAHLSRRSLLGLAGAGAGALLLGACGDDKAEDPNAPQTINWWHIQNTEPMLPVWAAMAKEYEAAHSNVKVTVQPLENEAFKAKLTTATQAGSPPDLFQSWGGGVLKQQVDAGLVKDLTDDVKPWIGNLLPASVQPFTIDGKIYGVPFDIGMVGFWYNKDLFAKAGVTAAPKTWTELLTAVGRIKAAGVVPIALAGKEKWPGHYYWAYLAMRIGGLGALQQAAKDHNFDTPDFVAAGQRLKELVDLKPFQKGFLGAGYGTPDGQAATMGNGGAAMELMGQWAPAVEASSSTSKKGLGDKLGFFPFPAVDGGKGSVAEAFGGGNGFAVGKDAPAATVDFLKTLLEVGNQRKAAATGAVLPTVKDAVDGIKDPNNKTVAETLASATGFQLYLDQAYPPAVGQQVNDSVAELIAGSKTPEQIVKDISTVAKSQ
ncbi:extracellular solute-binding protein [Micromonospora chersina]|uniref:Raffinose/stachyose/melibiose transport system substrate-binding protein n=1 Tax=Micromonospora chersina TaxID=47854 RepID=A0A1C6UPN0_9ACTN|nr:extracellular solute-binding protein [Micromonospora chersina]SCL55991.1 raffinose/stachyose/melibiose transport system substrate-binding protein [Micromonospora chersina]